MRLSDHAPIATLVVGTEHDNIDLEVIRELGMIREKIGGPGHSIADQMVGMVRLGRLSSAEAISCLWCGIMVDVKGKGVCR